MKILKKVLLVVAVIGVAGYVGLCLWFYSAQGKALFRGVKLDKSHRYHFDQKFEEKTILTKDGKKLNGILFKADSSKGVILWLPGGRGMLDSVGHDAKYYTRLNYDIFMINYRGFGKSEGSISNENQFYDDMQAVYNNLKEDYAENQIVIFGYSLGSGPAAQLASANKPKMLILQAPYYTMAETVQKALFYLPVSLLLNYKFETFKYIGQVKSRVVIFHGDSDKNIDVESSVRLKKMLKDSDELIILPGQGHNNFVNNPMYLKELSRVLR